MTDYFALLDQPRAPWLDLIGLKEAYHKKTLLTHPDTAGTPARFAELNEAYQVLRDPKRRLHHLLSLENCAPASADQTVPGELHDLFPLVGRLSQEANLLLEKIRTASGALAQSLLKSELLAMQNETKELREKIQDLSDASLAQLRQINPDWRDNLAALSNLYFRFAYLARWSAQLDEMAFRLSA